MMTAVENRRRRLLGVVRGSLPFFVSAALLGYLFSRIDVAQALGYVTETVALRFVGPLVLFNLLTLALEAHCIHRVATSGGAHVSHLTGARIKAACYLLSILNYAIGAAGLSVLMRRRARVGMAEAASMVFLISLFDVGSVAALAAVAATFQQSGALGVRVGLLGLLLLAIVGGFVFLKAPISLGPLDRLRKLSVFSAPREASLPLLIELALLRALFIGSYVALAAALFWAYDIEVGAVQLAMSLAIMLVISALPIAAGGLGTGQIVFVELFSGLAPDAQLLSASIVFSVGLLATRAMLGFLFAHEFTREALSAARAEADDAGSGA
ncbi:MAG: hypothetical protein CL908_18480 [Deltaproteobacteria bacterium]|jgi:uncharacterized membrane protein YbhN (UPF0104 family)|nr:hypothetical protein [Deltaproteobacteria bacterium]